MCRHFIEKLEQTISQKPKGTKNRMTGKLTTITFNNSQRTKEALGLHIYIQEANKLNKIRYKLTTNTTGDRK